MINEIHINPPVASYQNPTNSSTHNLVRQAKALLQSFEADATFDLSSSQD